MNGARFRRMKQIWQRNKEKPDNEESYKHGKKVKYHPERKQGAMGKV